MKLSQDFVKKLDKIFNRYAGAVVEGKPRMRAHEGQPYTMLEPADGDPIAATLRRQTGHDVVFILDDGNKDTGARATYPALQAFVAPGEDGKFRITKSWNLGIR